MKFFLSLLIIAAALLSPSGAAAQVPAPPVPAPVSGEILKAVRFDQRLGEQLSLETPFRDETGRPVKLGDYFHRRPVVLALVYHECPMLCNQVLNGLVTTLRAIDFTPGKEYEVVVISISPTESHELAAKKKRGYVTKYARLETAGGWHFLTGDEPHICKIADEVGYHYEFDPKSKQYAHASGIVLLTPGGKISKYFFGIDYPTTDVRMGLMEASEERIGSAIDQLLLLCFHYDPLTGRYSLAVMRIIQTVGVLTVLGLGSFIATMLIRERRQPITTAGVQEAIHG